jgi:chloramphenicol O-acetyltransferase type A
MREIDLDSWPRRRHFEHFKTYGLPHFNMCANIDLTAFQAWVESRRISFTIAFVHAVARTANSIPEFRWRMRGERVVEHDIVDPSVTILVRDDLFSFCTIPYRERLTDFAPEASTIIEHTRSYPSLEDEPGRDDLLFMTAIPWVTFTSFTHPMPLKPPDSIPRFAWGRFFEDGTQRKIPLSVQGHHALMDGLHLGEFYKRIQNHLQSPSSLDEPA